VPALSPAQKQLVQDNIPLSLHAANARFRRYHGRLGLEDLVSAAQIGLIQAALKYRPERDPDKKAWTTYAMTSMSNTMKEAIQSQGVIRIPRWVFSRSGRAKLMERQAEFDSPKPERKRSGGRKDRWLWLDVRRAQHLFPEAAIEPVEH
jgi:DNA-directed RNA polymerase specialized sigma subunit